MSLDPSKFKNVREEKNKQDAKMAVVIIVCIFLSQITFGLSLIYMFYYIIKQSTTKINSENSITYEQKDKDNLYEVLEDDTTEDYYKNDINDISQEEIHEHREDFWNVNSPIKYK